MARTSREVRWRREYGGYNQRSLAMRVKSDDVNVMSKSHRRNRQEGRYLRTISENEKVIGAEDNAE
jgi:hypothetical protein